jgi:hypothetical protein
MLRTFPSVLCAALSLAACAPAAPAVRPVTPVPSSPPEAPPHSGAAAPAAEANPDARFNDKAWAAAAAGYDRLLAQGAGLSIQQRVRAAIAWLNAGDKDRAFAWMARAFTGGGSPKVLAGIASLKPLVDDPRWEALAQKHAEACNAPEHRQFDFWVGTWDVKDPQGTIEGVNIIERDLKGCLLIERWTAQDGSRGQSVNFYDMSVRRWRQTWVDESGRIIYYEGSLSEDGSMRLEGELVLRDGTRLQSRMRFIPEAPDRVRQIIENSSDGGRSWQPWFDGIYHRQGAAAGGAPKKG